MTDYGQFLEAKKHLDQFLPKRDFKQTITRRSLEHNLEPLELSKLQTANQKIDVKISPYLKRFYDNYEPLSDTKKSHISKLRDLSKDLGAALLTVEKVYGDMAKVCASLHHAAAEFNQENKNAEDDLLEKTFFALQNNFICMSEVYKKESESIYENLYKLFNGWQKDQAVVEDLIKLRNQANDEYFSFKADLKDRKMKLLNGKEKVDFNEISMKFCCIDTNIEDFKRHKLKFMLPEVPSS